MLEQVCCHSWEPIRRRTSPRKPAYKADYFLDMAPIPLGNSLSFYVGFEVFFTGIYIFLLKRLLHPTTCKPLLLVAGLTFSQHESTGLLLPWNSLWLHVGRYRPTQPDNQVAPSSLSERYVNLHFHSEPQNDKSSLLLKLPRLSSIKSENGASAWTWSSGASHPWTTW